MKIAMIHYRIGETDGVSLEMDKWKLSFEKLGHEVIYISGDKSAIDSVVVPRLSFKTAEHKKFFSNSYVKLTDYTEGELIDTFEKYSDELAEDLIKIIEDNNIDMIVPNNVSSLGFNVPIGIGIAKLIERTNIVCLYHHHDFYWERDRYSKPTCNYVTECLSKYFPFNNERTKHCVINQIAKAELMTRKGIDSVVVPNVFDFSAPLWIKDDYNRYIRNELGIKDNDLVFLQATRIADRKAIEMAVDLLNVLFKYKDKLIGRELYNGEVFTKHSEIYFVLAGMNELEDDRFEILNRRINESKFKSLYINDMVGHSRGINGVQQKYSLWDIYTISDFVTYPSILEGWGNQLLEALFAKIPIVTYEYPVFETDISKFGLNIVSLGKEYSVDQEGMFYVKEEIYEECALKIIDILTSKVKYYEVSNANFDIAAKYLSYEALNDILESVMCNIKI